MRTYKTRHFPSFNTRLPFPFFLEGFLSPGVSSVLCASSFGFLHLFIDKEMSHQNRGGAGHTACQDGETCRSYYPCGGGSNCRRPPRANSLKLRSPGASDIWRSRLPSQAAVIYSKAAPEASSQQSSHVADEQRRVSTEYEFDKQIGNYKSIELQYEDRLRGPLIVCNLT